MPADFVAAQIDAVFADLDVGAVKIGMLSQAAIVETVAAALDRHQAKNVVLDPVMVASSGDRLLAPDAVDAVRRLLIPRARVITPNLPEAALLLDTQVAHDETQMEAQARALIERFDAQAVLIKGGHGESAESVDLLVEQGGVTRFAEKRIATKKHPRHRLHAVVGHCRRSRQGPRSDRRRGRGQGLCHRRHRGRRQTQCRSRPRAAAPFR